MRVVATTVTAIASLDFMGALSDGDGVGVGAVVELAVGVKDPGPSGGVGRNGKCLDGYTLGVGVATGELGAVQHDRERFIGGEQLDLGVDPLTTNHGVVVEFHREGLGLQVG